jgi:hypothetical protein
LALIIFGNLENTRLTLNSIKLEKKSVKHHDNKLGCKHAIIEAGSNSISLGFCNYYFELSYLRSN